MAILASVVILRAQKTLLDESGVLWSDVELLSHLNAGISSIVATKPDAYTALTTLSLVSGTAQTIPVDGAQFLDAYNNNLGGAVRQIERNYLDHSRPGWHADTAAATLHVVADRRDPKRFWVWPPAGNSNTLRILYAANPPKLFNSAATIPLDEIYENPLHSFVVAYAYSKNTKRGDMAKFRAYLELFGNQIGAKSAVQFNFAPAPPDGLQDDEARNPRPTVGN